MTLDPEALAGLRALDDGAGGVLRELARMFLADFPARIRLLDGAAARGNFRAVAAEAHTLKASAGNLGARRLAELCFDLEQRPEGRTDEIRAELDRVRGELDRLLLSPGGAPDV